MTAAPRPDGPQAALSVAGRWPAPHVAVGVTWTGRGVLPPPAGLHRSTSPAGGTSAWWGEADLVQPWASVTKVVVSLAVLVAVEEGTVALDEPAGPPGATVAHLLAHASGLGPDGGILARPARRRIYSNAGFEVLAEVVSMRAGMTFATYLAEAVLQPLGMSGTRLPPGASPAWGAAGPLRDLLVLAGEWLRPSLVDPATVRHAATVAFGGLAGVVPGIGRFDPCDWGLGVELRSAKQPHWTGTANSPGTFGHFGRSGSFVWVDPSAGVAAAVLTGRDFGPWAMEHWPPWSDGVLAAILRVP